MKNKLMKISPLAALMMAAHCVVSAQEGNTPATSDDPVLPNLPDSGLPPAAPAKPQAQASDSSLLDSPITNKRDGLAPVPVNLTGISLFADKRHSAREEVTAWEVAQKEMLTPGVQLVGELNTPEPESLRSSLVEYINRGRPVSYRDLQAMVDVIEKHYRSHNRPMTHVYIPKQSIYSDKVVISIVEGRVGDTKIFTEADLRDKPASQLTGTERSYLARMDEEKNWWTSWYSNPYRAKDLEDEFSNGIAQLKGRIVDTEEIKSQIAGMNRSPWVRLKRPVVHPFRDVSVNFAQPEDDVVGTTNLIFEVRDQRPMKFFAGFDNALTEVTGENRMFLGAAWYDAFCLGLNHQMGVQVFSALDPNKLLGVSGSYQIPWQDPSLNQFTDLFAAYADSTTTAMFGGIPTEVSGSSLIFGGRHYLELPGMFGASDVSMPLGAKRELQWAKPIREPMGVHHEIGLGIDYKKADNNLYFGGTTVAASPADICQAVLEYNARQTDPTGETGLAAQLFYSPGGITGNNSDTAFAPLRKDAKASYFYTKIRLDREQDLPFSGGFEGMMFKGVLTGQYSSENLLASEQLGLGGYGSVRGYPERALRGDIGYICNLELYSPEFHPSRDWFRFSEGDKNGGIASDDLKFLVFFDYAHGESSKNSVADPLDDAADLMSVGVGLRYAFSDAFSLRLDYGFRLIDLPIPANNANSGAIHFAAACSF